jgi:hypothetical protein
MIFIIERRQNFKTMFLMNGHHIYSKPRIRWIFLFDTIDHRHNIVFLMISKIISIFSMIFIKYSG